MLLAVFIWVGQAFAVQGHVYLAPRFDETRKVLELHFIANIDEELYLEQLWLQSLDRTLRFPLRINTTFRPGGETSLALPVPHTSLRASNIAHWKIVASSGVLKAAPLILVPGSKNNTAKLPPLWQINEGKLRIPAGQYLIRESLVIPHATHIEAGTSIQLQEDTTLTFENDVHADGVEFKLPATASAIVISGEHVRTTWKKLRLTGGADIHDERGFQQGSLVFYGGQHLIEGLDLTRSQAASGLWAQEAQLKISDAFFHDNRSVALSSRSSSIDVTRARFENMGKAGVRGLNSELTLSEVHFSQIYGQAIELAQKSHGQITRCSIKQTFTAVEVTNSATANISRTILRDNRLDLAAYQNDLAWAGGVITTSEMDWRKPRIENDAKSSVHEKR